MGEHIYKFIARFVDGATGEPFTGPNLRVRFFDRDGLKDDLLGESPLGADGSAAIMTTTSSFRSGLMGAAGATLGEAKPDVYCEVIEGDAPVYRSKVAWNLGIEKENAVTGGTERTIDLGTFNVKRGEGLGEPETDATTLKPRF
jgi:hypothetical protein